MASSYGPSYDGQRPLSYAAVIRTAAKRSCYKHIMPAVVIHNNMAIQEIGVIYGYGRREVNNDGARRWREHSRHMRVSTESCFEGVVGVGVGGQQPCREMARVYWQRSTSGTASVRRHSSGIQAQLTRVTTNCCYTRHIGASRALSG